MSDSGDDIEPACSLTITSSCLSLRWDLKGDSGMSSSLYESRLCLVGFTSVLSSSSLFITLSALFVRFVHTAGTAINLSGLTNLAALTGLVRRAVWEIWSAS